MFFYATVQTGMDGETSESDVVQPLPRGRHRLSRKQVLASQRGRMLAAMAEAVAEKGYARTAVADVIERAGVSRETFYEHFSDKEDCFLAAYDTGGEALLEVIEAALAGSRAGPEKRLDRVLSAYFSALADEPAFARTFLIEVYAVGPRALRRRAELQQRFVATVADIFGLESASRRSSERFACEALVAAVSSLVTTRVGAGRLDELDELRAPLVGLARRMVPGASARPVRRARA
jgi:AcrR family transcriptional regulator